MIFTYLNQPALKSAFLAEITKHEEQDAIVKGTYGQMNGSFKGCAIGCALHSLNVLQGKVGKDSAVATDQHQRYEAELGLPTWFAYLEDNIFENLPDEFAETWPRRIADAIPVGAVVDDMVLAKILRWSLADAKFGVRHATDNEEIRNCIDIVIAGFDAEIETVGHATAEQREAAKTAAWAAWAARAAWGAWDARAARAPWGAWDARAARAPWAAWAAWAARAAWPAWAARAAWAAWDAWGAWGAWAAFYPALSEYVISLVQELPVGNSVHPEAR